MWLFMSNTSGPACRNTTEWKSQKVMLHIQLKRPTISTLFQRPSEGAGKCDFRVTAGGSKKMMAIQTTKGVTAATHTAWNQQFWSSECLWARSAANLQSQRVLKTAWRQSWRRLEDCLKDCLKTGSDNHSDSYFFVEGKQNSHTEISMEAPLINLNPVKHAGLQTW